MALRKPEGASTGIDALSDGGLILAVWTSTAEGEGEDGELILSAAEWYRNGYRKAPAIVAMADAFCRG